MRRALLLCMMLALGAGCERPSVEKNQDVAGASPSESPAAPAPVSIAGGGSTTRLPLSGAPRRNKYLQLGVMEAGFDPAAPSAPQGLRFFTVGLRGIGRARGNDFILDFQSFVFAQNDMGCIARPEADAAWLRNPFGPTAQFTTAAPTDGQLAFLVPDDTERVRVLIASAEEDAALIVPAGEDFVPAWPTPVHVIEDGSTLRVQVLPGQELPPTFPSAAAGRKFEVLDFVIENLSTTQGVEFATSQQLRLVDALGNFIQPSALTHKLGCRLDDGDVIPPGHARRLMAVYDIPAGTPRRVQYRGFEVDEAFADLD